MLPFPGTDRFVSQRCLGSGSFGSVYEAFDKERQALVALKVPHESTAKGLFLFKREFRALADVSHPNLVRFHELLSNDSLWFFTMELVIGTDILRFLRLRQDSRPVDTSGIEPDSGIEATPPTQPDASAPVRALVRKAKSPSEGEAELHTASAPQNLALLSSTFKQLTHGLMALHQAGLLHKDIKPSNVLVSEEGRVVLLDFGLASEIDAVNTGMDNASEITGTPAYMAPEQLLDNRCTEKSDWYSVGVLLYHVLTGRLPFQGNGLRVLINKVSQHPTPPRELISSIPEGISDLCMALLCPQPEERPGGLEILQHLEQSRSLARTARFTAPSQEFVSRDWELEQLLEAFRSLEEGRAGWVNMHGGSGMGKSFLIRKFRREILKRTPDALVFSGRCYEQEHVPYKALDGVVDELSHYLRHVSNPRMDALMPRHICALAQLFPVLKQVPRIAETQRTNPVIIDPQELRRRAFAALRELLMHIGDSRPLVLIIDDMQWGDTDSAALLTDLLSPPDAPVMLFVACFRTEETATSPVLRNFLTLGRSALGRCTEIPLKELSPEQSRDLALKLLHDGMGSDDLVEWIVRESRGNPFYIHELAQHANLRQHMDASPENLESYIQARVSALPVEARSLLSLTALAGYPLDWPLLREAAAIDTSGIESLDLLRQGHFIRIRAMEKRRMVETYHDFIRTALVAAMPITQAQEGHLRLAQVLERAPQPDVQALALHYQAAGNVEKAIDYVTTAGHQAADALAFAKAASLFRLSLRLRLPDDPRSAPVWKRLGEVLASAGRGKEAAEAYLKAVTFSEPREASSLKRLAAQEYLRNGHFEEGIGVLEGVLSAIGDRLAGSPAQSILSALYHRFLLWIRGVRFEERRAEEVPQSVLDRLDAYWVITMGLATGDLMRVADFQARQLLLGLQTGEPVRLVRALAYEAIFNSASGNRGERRTQKFLDMAMVLAERTGDLNAFSQALIAYGIAHTALGRWRKGAEFLDKVELQLREGTSGLAYEVRNARSYALINHYALGNLRVLAERLPAQFRDAEETGDLLYLANLHTGSAFIHYLAKDEPDVARKEIQACMGKLPMSGFFYQRYLEMVALGNIELYQGQALEGWALLSARWRTLRRSHLMKVQAIRISCLEMRARLALSLASGSSNASDKHHHLFIAKKDIKDLQQEKTDYGEALALRLQTILAWIENRRKEAQGFAFLAEMAFDACDMALHAQVMKRCRGLMREGAGGTQCRGAEEWMHQQGIQSPERIMAMFLPGMDFT